MFDDAILDEAPAMIGGWAPSVVRAACAAGRTSFFADHSVEGLAARAGINAAGLATAIGGFNYGVETGHDFFGRQHAPRPIAKGPFYAIRMQGTHILGAAGLAANDDLQVIRPDGTPIPNLYAAGEILGGSQFEGRSACGEMMATPALTFGRLLGEKILPI